MLIFGGGHQDIDLQDAFEFSFGCDQNTEIWAVIGLNPFNRNCLNDNKVKHEIVMRDGVIDVDADPLAEKLLDIEFMNHQAVLLMNDNGYNGDALLTHTPKVETLLINTDITEPLSRDRQDLLAKAATVGGQFHATGGEFLNSDDFLIVEERKNRTEVVKEMQSKKKEYELQGTIAEEVKVIFEK